MMLKAEIKKNNSTPEYSTPERCFIREIANDAADEEVSIAQARVEPGITTAWHKLKGIAERYSIISGLGYVEIEGLAPANVCAGDIVRIPPDTPQRITNTGTDDLVFLAICSPRFMPESYIPLE